MHGIRPAKFARGHLRQSDVTEVAGSYQLGERADGFFDGSARVNAVVVVQVDHIDLQAVEAFFHAVVHIVAISAGPKAIGVGCRRNAELGRHKYLGPAAAKQLGNEFLVLALAVDVRRVDHPHADVDRIMEGGERFRPIRGAVDAGQGHRAEPLGWGGELSPSPKVTSLPIVVTGRFFPRAMEESIRVSSG